MCIAFLFVSQALFSAEIAAEAKPTSTVPNTSPPQNSVVKNSLPADLVAAFAKLRVNPNEDVWNNKYFIESIRLINLAKTAYNSAKYQDCITYSQQAEAQAALSDQYILNYLQRVRDANNTIRKDQDALAKGNADAKAKKQDFKKMSRAQLLNFAQEALDAALASRKKEDWENALTSATAAWKAIATLASLPPEKKGLSKLPVRYKVRTWYHYRDCFWNIALLFYGNPDLWPLIYRANKKVLPCPNNPDLLPVGTIIIIPRIADKARHGDFDESLVYRGK
jgi:nucleoid-associated protein YgaU